MIHTTLPGVEKLGERNQQYSGCGVKNEISSSNRKLDTCSTPKYAMTLCGIMEKMRTYI
jgi:hypothetical protein